MLLGPFHPKRLEYCAGYPAFQLLPGCEGIRSDGVAPVSVGVLDTLVAATSTLFLISPRVEPNPHKSHDRKW